MTPSLCKLLAMIAYVKQLLWQVLCKPNSGVLRGENASEMELLKRLFVWKRFVGSVACPENENER